MTLPETTVVLASGERTNLSDLCAKGPVAFIFLRHLGCPFCHEQIRRLSKATDLDVIFVGLAEPERAKALLRKWRSPHRIVCDPQARLARHFYLMPGGFWNVFGPPVWFPAVSAFVRGRLPLVYRLGDIWHLPAAFVVDQSGAIVFTHHGRHAADTLTESTLRHALASAVLESPGRADEERREPAHDRL